MRWMILLIVVEAVFYIAWHWRYRITLPSVELTDARCSLLNAQIRREHQQRVTQEGIDY